MSVERNSTYVDRRFRQFEKSESALAQEHKQVIDRFEHAVNVWQPRIYLALRALIILLPLIGILVDLVSSMEFSWFSASGALITLLGILTQVYRMYLNDLYLRVQQLSLERCMGNVFYYAYRTQAEIKDIQPMDQYQEDGYFQSVYQASGKIMRSSHDLLSTRKQRFELLMLFVGTIIWAYGSL